MKRLDELEIAEILNIYKNIFLDLINEDIYINLFNKYSKIYQKYISMVERGYKIKGGTMGRGELKWGRNIIYGWFFEDILLELLQKNKFISSVSFYGGDTAKNFIYSDEDSKIDIPGFKTSKPDLFLELKSGKKICIEIKTAAKDVYTIKKSNVESLFKEFAENEIISYVMMFDLNSKLFSLKDLFYFQNLKPFVNTRMEGQLCYDFPKPDQPIEIISSLSFSDDLNSVNSDDYLKKLKILSYAKKSGNKKLISVISAKISIEKKEEKLNHLKNQIDAEIAKIKKKNPDAEVSWQEIYNLLKL